MRVRVRVRVRVREREREDIFGELLVMSEEGVCVCERESVCV